MLLSRVQLFKQCLILNLFPIFLCPNFNILKLKRKRWVKDLRVWRKPLKTDEDWLIAFFASCWSLNCWLMNVKFTLLWQFLTEPLFLTNLLVLGGLNHISCSFLILIIPIFNFFLTLPACLSFCSLSAVSLCLSWVFGC